jgi:hypothetical protein
MRPCANPCGKRTWRTRNLMGASQLIAIIFQIVAATATGGRNGAARQTFQRRRTTLKATSEPRW